jgi:hypothetical protein
MRDGFCDVEMCDHINKTWGNKVNKVCAKRVLLALHEQFDDEMKELKALDSTTDCWQLSQFILMLIHYVIFNSYVLFRKSGCFDK